MTLKIRLKLQKKIDSTADGTGKGISAFLTSKYDNTTTSGRNVQKIGRMRSLQKSNSNFYHERSRQNTENSNDLVVSIIWLQEGYPSVPPICHASPQRSTLHATHASTPYKRYSGMPPRRAVSLISTDMLIIKVDMLLHVMLRPYLYHFWLLVYSHFLHKKTT